MLYLNGLFYLISKYPIRTFAYLLATVVMGFVFLAEGVLDKKISEQIAFKLDEESYFTALISTKENYNMLVRKMIYLPGVEKVKVIGPEELNSKVTKAISAMKINIPLTAGGLSSNFVGMKVFFKDGLRDETKELVMPRQIIMYLMREEVDASFPNIGQELGGRDHTTAMHAHSKIKNKLIDDDKLKQDITLLRQKIFNSTV